MATLNFTGAHTFTITGGIYSEARHVTMISSSADPRLIARRDRHRHGPSSSHSSSSRRRPRTPSPSSSESSFASSNDSGPSTRSSPPTSVDEHESSLSQPVPPSSHERPEVLSPLSSRLGAMAGLTTPVDVRTPVVSRLTNLPSHSHDRVTPVLPWSNEASAAAGNNVSPRFYRHPGVESAGDVGVRIRPQGPRRPRPLPPTPSASQYVQPGTPADFSSITDSHSHNTDSLSSSSWDTFIQEPPRSFARSSTVPPRPPQPILPSRRTVRVDVLAPSPFYAISTGYPSRSSSTQAFMTSPIREPFVESVTSPSRRSVQSPPPNLPFQTRSLPTQSTPSTRTSRSRRSIQSPPQSLLFQPNSQHLPFQPIPLPPQSTPPHTSAASRSYVTSRSSRPAFRPSPGPIGQPHQSSLWPVDHPQLNMQPPTLYQHVPRPPPAQNLPNQDFIYISSSGTPQHYLPRSPNFAAASLASYLSPLRSEQSGYEHSYEYY